MALELYNTMTRKKEVFEPLREGQVGVYVCGPTVYGHSHLGHAKSYVSFDVLVRYLRYLGYATTYVQNITDVGHLTDDADAGDDKLERAAARAGRRAADIASEYTRQWIEDCRSLGCLEPEVLCKATDHIPEQLELVRQLEAKGYTYRIDDGIYFDTAKFPRYEEFARLDLAGQEAGARIGDVPGKRRPADFALWKFSPPDVMRQQEWDSPWGRGFPGWHLECSAMSIRYLGRSFDIHTGGVDHVQVHHTNEIAQSECALEVHPWVGLWMHVEFLDLRGAKMSKSKGEVTVLNDLVAAGYPARAYRYFFLQAHYRQQQTFTEEAMQAAATGYERLLGHAAAVRGAEGGFDPAGLAPHRERFRDSVRDDLNAPRALAVAWDVARSTDLTPAERWSLLNEFDGFLGLDLEHAVPASQVSESDPRIDALLEQREQARRSRAFAEADRIRDELSAEGIEIEDTPQGPRWRRM